MDLGTVLGSSVVLLNPFPYISHTSLVSFGKLFLKHLQEGLQDQFGTEESTKGEVLGKACKSGKHRKYCTGLIVAYFLPDAPPRPALDLNFRGLGWIWGSFWDPWDLHLDAC